MIIRKTRKNKSEKVFTKPDKDIIEKTALIIFNNYDIFEGVPTDSYLKDIARAIAGSVVDSYSTQELGNAIFLKVKDFREEMELRRDKVKK
jgi:hypothetical protein